MTLNWYNLDGILIESFKPATFAEAVLKARDWTSLCGFAFLNADEECQQSWWFQNGRKISGPETLNQPNP